MHITQPFDDQQKQMYICVMHTTQIGDSMDNNAHLSPTEESYNELQKAYNFFNESLFNGELPSCLITFQRVKNTYGYHSSKRWTNKEGNKTDEIAMNPTYFATRKVNETLSTLAHEMVHLWQEYFGSPGRGRYHNKEWAAKMKTIGLQPFNVVNDKRETGDRVSHYIVEGGKFDNIVKAFLKSGFTITWLDRMITPQEEIEEWQDNIDEEIIHNIEIIDSSDEEKNLMQKSTGGQRSKYSCPNEHYSVWGKKGINPICGECKEYMLDNSNESFTGETQNDEV